MQQQKPSSSLQCSSSLLQQQRRHATTAAAPALTIDSYATLQNGTRMPRLGVGLWRSDPTKLQSVITTALAHGYTQFDSAWIYGQHGATDKGAKEQDIGAALTHALQHNNEDNITRERLFITSKLWPQAAHPTRVKLGVTDSLRKLQLTYFDLYMVHWPYQWQYDNSNPLAMQQDVGVTLKQTWVALEALVDAGVIKSLGVSNFSELQLTEILGYARHRPQVNQVEIHVSTGGRK